MKWLYVVPIAASPYSLLNGIYRTAIFLFNYYLLRYSTQFSLKCNAVCFAIVIISKLYLVFRILYLCMELFFTAVLTTSERGGKQFVYYLKGNHILIRNVKHNINHCVWCYCNVLKTSRSKMNSKETWSVLIILVSRDYMWSARLLQHETGKYIQQIIEIRSDRIEHSRLLPVYRRPSRLHN